MRYDRAGRRRMTRREFGRLVSAGTALPALGIARAAPPPAPDYVPPPRPLLSDAPPFAAPLAFTRSPVAPRAVADPDSWIKPGDGPQVFRTAGQKRDVTLLPLNRLFDRRYSVYWQVSEQPLVAGSRRSIDGQGGEVDATSAAHFE